MKTYNIRVLLGRVDVIIIRGLYKSLVNLQHTSDIKSSLCHIALD